jgi:hypothetical protein
MGNLFMKRETMRREERDGLGAVILVIEQNAWGAFKTEFYSIYDFKPIWEAMPKK